jgi:hypothetical protein
MDYYGLVDLHKKWQNKRIELENREYCHRDHLTVLKYFEEFANDLLTAYVESSKDGT